MNILFVGFEVFFIFLILVLFYKCGKKDALYMFICLISSILGMILIGTIDIFSFQVSIGIPFIMGIFICSNIIVQKYGIDETKKILCIFSLSYIISVIVVGLLSFTSNNVIDISSNEIFDNLFGYALINVRCIISNFFSMIIMLWISTNIYYSFRKGKNILLISNVVTAFVVAFVESLIFILISYTGSFDVVELFGMLVVRYVFEVIVSIIGLIPVFIIVKFIGE